MGAGAKAQGLDGLTDAEMTGEASCVFPFREFKDFRFADGKGNGG